MRYVFCFLTKTCGGFHHGKHFCDTRDHVNSMYGRAGLVLIGHLHMYWMCLEIPNKTTKKFQTKSICSFTLPETNIAHENPIFPGKYHQNGGFSMAMLVFRECKWLKPIDLWRPLIFLGGRLTLYVSFWGTVMVDRTV